MITEAGNDPKVAGSCISPRLHRTRASPLPPLSKIRRPAHLYHRCCLRAYLFLDRAKFRASFAADVDARVGEGADKRYAWPLLIRDKSRKR